MSWIGKIVGGGGGAALGIGIGFALAGPLGAGVAAGIGMGLFSAGTAVGSGVDQKIEASEMNEKMKTRNEAAMAKQERQAEVMARKAFNEKAQRYAAATVSAQKELLDTERERAADNRNYGNPVG